MAETGNMTLYWLFQAPNLILAALMYTLLGRFVLALFFDEDSDKVIWKSFRQITQPVVALVQTVTPLAVPPRVIVLFAVIWVMILRLALLLGFAAAGLLPALNVGAQP
jgi:YggT family protein